VAAEADRNGQRAVPSRESTATSKPNTSSTKPDAINAWTARSVRTQAGFPSVPISLVITGVALIVGGMVVGNLTGRPLRRSGRRQLALGAVAVAVSYGIGHLIGSPIS
jgi:hypothetical protein